MRPIPKKEKKEKKKKKKTDLKTKEQKAKDQVPTTVTPPSRRHVHFPQDKTDEIADLIDKLGKMSIHDSNYRSMYFKVIRFALHMEPFLKSPPRVQDGSALDANPTASILPPRPKTPTSTYTGPIICYCCGEAGHGTRQCPTAEEMVQAGTIIRNDTGRITWKDGTTILRVGNETILAAINRELTNRNKTTPSTNFICQSLPFEDATSDEEEKPDIIVKNGQVYAAIKPKDDKKLKKKGHVDPKKRMIFDGVDIPQ